MHAHYVHLSVYIFIWWGNKTAPEELALELLQQSWQLTLEVNTMTYNAAISACEMLGNQATCNMQSECFFHRRTAFNVYINVHSELFITVDALKDASAKNPW